MKLTHSRLYLLLALLTVAIGVVTSLATSQLPIWLQPYLWLSWPILGVLAVIFVILSVYQAHQESPQSQRPSEPESPLRKYRSNRKVLHRYLEQLIEEHKYFTFLGRAKPLDLEKIYIALRVGEYVPRQLQPDESVQAEGDELPKQRSGTVEVPEALQLHRRLAVLGEPGSGKTTLLKYLVLRTNRQDPSLGAFAREIVQNRLARLVDGMCRSPFTVPTIISTLFLGGGFLLWLVGLGLKHSTRPVLGVIAGISLFVFFIVVLGLAGRKETKNKVTALIFTILSVLVSMCCGLFEVVPLWVASIVGIIFVLQLIFPFFLSPSTLIWLREYLTRYPLPFYLTLNDLATTGKSIEDRLERALREVGFRHAQRLLQRRLERGECLILLDALDEVVDEEAYRRVVDEINRFAVAYYRNQIVVTCRIAGFRGLLQGFLQLEVQEFNEKQVALFIRNWFADSPPNEQESLVDGLLRCLGRNVRMRVLASNPLLASIIALLYEHKLTLPERRVELYEECARVLLEELERLKGLDIEARFPTEKKQKALQSIATHFHQKGTRIFTEKVLLAALEGALPNLGYPSTRSREFLQEIMERSGLLRQKSRISYDFCHLTFQEYFTAAAFYAKGNAESLFGHLGDPWWREVILLFVGLKDDATKLLERFRKHDVMLSADALADARPVQTNAFERIAGEIIAELKHLMEEDSQRRQEAADALAEITRWGASEYLVEKARAEERPAVALAAVLGLARAADREILDRVFEPILRLLNGSLGRFNTDVDERILSLLETLGFPMVFVPAGEFVMGYVACYESTLHRVYLDDYWIDKYPVTNTQFHRFVSETGYQSQGDWLSGFTSGKEKHPVVNVSWHDAAAFCKWVGKYFPTEAQWEKAARGADGRAYPWGNKWDGSCCNTRTHADDTTPVERYPGGVSPYGCYDMVGNVVQWCADWYDKDYYQHSPKRNPVGPTQGEQRVLKSYVLADFSANYCVYYRNSQAPNLAKPCLLPCGFRCAVSRVLQEGR